MRGVACMRGLYAWPVCVTPPPPPLRCAQERVVEAAFLHQRYAPARADEADHAALVVATKHDLFNIGA